MLQQPIAGGVGGAVSCPKDGKGLDPWNDVGHEVGVYPVDDASVHVCYLKQRGDLRISGAAIHPDHVSHSPVAAVVNDHRHACFDVQENGIRLGRANTARMVN